MLISPFYILFQENKNTVTEYQSRFLLAQKEGFEPSRRFPDLLP